MGTAIYPYVDEWGDRCDLAFEMGHYQTNGRLAIEAWRRADDEAAWEPYATVTVNLWEPIDGEDCAYLDANDSPALVRWLVEQGHVSLIPRVARSGFCEYQEGRFSSEFLMGCLRPEERHSHVNGEDAPPRLHR